jgi:hypothetical protein
VVEGDPADDRVAVGLVEVEGAQVAADPHLLLRDGAELREEAGQAETRHPADHD